MQVKISKIEATLQTTTIAGILQTKRAHVIYKEMNKMQYFSKVLFIHF